MKSKRYSRQILMKLDFSRQSFDKYSNIEFHENPSSGSRVFHTEGWTDRRTDGQKDRQTDRRDADNSGFSQFANAPKMADLFAISYSLYRQYFVVSLPKPYNLLWSALSSLWQGPQRIFV